MITPILHDNVKLCQTTHAPETTPFLSFLFPYSISPSSLKVNTQFYLQNIFSKFINAQNNNNNKRKLHLGTQPKIAINTSLNHSALFPSSCEFSPWLNTTDLGVFVVVVVVVHALNSSLSVAS